jgi:hypothetical protein
MTLSGWRNQSLVAKSFLYLHFSGFTTFGMFIAIPKYEKKEPYSRHHQNEDESKKRFKYGTERYPKGGLKQF